MPLTLNSVDIWQRITEACDHYEKSAPVVHSWLDDLYLRLGDNLDDAVISELLLVVELVEEGIWMNPNAASNRVYKLFDRLGRDTTGMAGF